MNKVACAIALMAGTGSSLGLLQTSARAMNVVPAHFSTLTLSVASVISKSSNGKYDIKMHYKGGSVKEVAIYIDGNLLTRRQIDTTTTKGDIEFRLSSSVISDGTHLITINATDAYGQVTTVHTSINPAAQSAASGALSLVSPGKNATIQGTIPINVQVDPSVAQPFVSFFLDNQLLAATNYAPFSYNWDSSKVSNGRHIITIELIDGNSQVRLETLHIPIMVNNPGGLTIRENSTPSLIPNHVASLASPISKLKHNITGITTLSQTPEISAPQLQINPSRGASATLSEPRLKIEQFATSEFNAALSTPFYHTPGMKFSPVVHQTAARPNPFKPGIQGRMAVVSNPIHFQTPNLNSALEAPAAHTSRSGNFAVLPSVPSGHQSVKHSVASAQFKRYRASNITEEQPLQIAFNNTRIVFDVPPRVVNGIPLAPFRQIFEHTGGKIVWNNYSKTVHAINKTHEIVFQVGHKTATINDQTVKMSMKPFIDRGRTIVPISFIKDALNVTVHYNAKNGHIRIESK